METFENPNVSDEVIDSLESILRGRPKYPWNILDQMEERGFSRQESRKALRLLKLRENKIAPAGDFVGKIKLVED